MMEITETLLKNLKLANWTAVEAAYWEWPSRAEWREMEEALAEGLVERLMGCAGKYGAYSTTTKGRIVLARAKAAEAKEGDNAARGN